MKIPKKIAWKASDGRMFHIDTDKEGIVNQEQLYAHIAKLRKDNGYDEPTFVSLYGQTPEGERFAKSMCNTTLDDVEPEYREEVERLVKEALNRTDPKSLN